MSGVSVDQRSHTSQDNSPPASVVLWSRRNPSFSSTWNDGRFHDRTVDQMRRRPVAKAASSSARDASVAYPRPCARAGVHGGLRLVDRATPDDDRAVAERVTIGPSAEHECADADCLDRGCHRGDPLTRFLGRERARTPRIEQLRKPSRILLLLWCEDQPLGLDPQEHPRAAHGAQSSTAYGRPTSATAGCPRSCPNLQARSCVSCPANIRGPAVPRSGRGVSGGGLDRRRRRERNAPGQSMQVWPVNLRYNTGQKLVAMFVNRL